MHAGYLSPTRVERSKDRRQAMSDQVATPQQTGDGSQKVEAAKEVSGRAAGRAGDVAGEAQAQVQAVAGQAKDQFMGLVDRGRRDLGDEAANRSRQMAG